MKIAFPKVDTWNINIGQSSNWQSNESRPEIVKKYRRNNKKRSNKKQGNRKDLKIDTVIDTLIYNRVQWYKHVS